jgi:hypothetical protein
MGYNRFMRAFCAFALVLAGCASQVASVENQPLVAAGWSGPPPRVGLSLTGSGATPADNDRCVAAVTRAGAIVDGNAAVQALVTVEQAGNRLQITSQRHGLVQDEPRPAWPVEHLCNDALFSMVKVLRKETPYVEPLDAPAPPNQSPSASPSASGPVNRPGF